MRCPRTGAQGCRSAERRDLRRAGRLRSARRRDPEEKDDAGPRAVGRPPRGPGVLRSREFEARPEGRPQSGFQPISANFAEREDVGSPPRSSHASLAPGARALRWKAGGLPTNPRPIRSCASAQNDQDRRQRCAAVAAVLVIVTAGAEVLRCRWANWSPLAGSIRRRVRLQPALPHGEGRALDRHPSPGRPQYDAARRSRPR